MDQHNCAVTRTNIDGTSKNLFTCFSYTSLISLAKDLNTHRKKKIINTTDYPYNKKKILYQRIAKEMAQYCDDTEVCWASQPFVTDKYTKEMTYRPIIPNQPRGWLSSLDLLAIGKQHEQRSFQEYSNPNNNLKMFHFLGVFPIDFESINDEMMNLSVRKLHKHGYEHIGMILNLDKHNQPGSHWVAYFLDLSQPTKQQYYYDSVANKPPMEVYRFANRIQKKLKKLNMSINESESLIFNRVRSQYKNSECGVYSWMFIQRLLEGKSFNEVTSQVIYDDQMHINRLSMFRKPDGYNPSEFHYVIS